MKNILFISRDFFHKGNLKQAELYQQEHINIINNSWMNTGNGFFYNALKTIGKLSISFGIMNTVNLLKKYQNEEFRKLHTTELKKVWANYYDPKKHGEEIKENLGWQS